MAFKVLDETELELMSEEQRLQYEQKLDLYYKRAEFVEILEKEKKIKKLSYEPVLVSMKEISEPEVKTLCFPEAQVVELPPKTEIHMKVPAVRLEEIPIRGLPDLGIMETAHEIGKMKNHSYREPVLESIELPQATEAGISISHITVPDIEMEKLMGNSLPKRAEIGIRVPAFKVSEDQRIRLPQSLPKVEQAIQAGQFIRRDRAGKLTKKGYKKPKLEIVELPKMTEAGISFSHIAVPDISLPKRAEIGIRVPAFKVSEDQRIRLPQSLPKVEQAIQAGQFIRRDRAGKLTKKGYKKPKLEIVELPKMTEAGISFSHITVPDISLPKRAEIGIRVPAFKAPEDKRIRLSKRLPKVVQVIQVGQFTRKERTEIQIDEGYKKTKLEIVELPQMTKAGMALSHITVPDISLPKRAEIGIRVPAFKAPEDQRIRLSKRLPKVVTPVCAGQISQRDYKKTNRKIAELPKRIVLKVPDAYEAMGIQI